VKSTIVLFLALLAAVVTTSITAQSRDRFKHDGKVEVEQAMTAPFIELGNATEAETGFDGQTNGFLVQGPDFETLTEEAVVALRSYNDNRFIFEEVESIMDGLGPVYNAQSCRECHQNVVTGGSSQITVQRTGRQRRDEFVESLGGNITHSRATDPELVELVDPDDNVRTFRISTNLLGSGYVEAISNDTLLSIRDQQPKEIRGVALETPVLEANNAARIGRFGWKSQHSSLESFAADAYLNEMGITSPLFPEENTSSGRFVGFGTGFDPVPDPEDDGIDVVVFADFMRSTQAPSRGEITTDVLLGETIFNEIGCNSCHVSALVTSPAGTEINGGAFVIPEALGNRIIHPYSDFLLHNIGTGDGVPVQSTAEFAFTANLMRTAPLWGLRTRSRMMHDGLSFTHEDVIRRHKNQASSASRQFFKLSAEDQQLMIAFLDSL
jgi:CxxC motif-containing protein (DUF1111 family)